MECRNLLATGNSWRNRKSEEWSCQIFSLVIASIGNAFLFIPGLPLMQSHVRHLGSLVCQPPAPELFHGRTCDYITRKPMRNVSIFKLCEIIVHLFSGVCVCVFVFWSSLDERYPRYRLYMTLQSSKILLEILLCPCFWVMLVSLVGFGALFNLC